MRGREGKGKVNVREEEEERKWECVRRRGGERGSVRERRGEKMGL